MGDRLRVGIIGVGWGALVQVPAFRAVPEYDVVALCARTRESVSAAGVRTGIDDLSTDWESFVRRDDLDVISVATPTVLHLDQVVAALRAGKHVLCEKPQALTDADATRMLTVAEETGLTHAVCFENRWSPEKLAARDLIADGYLGTPFSARVDATVGFWHPSHPLQSEWMYRLDQGGGYLLGLAAHDLDYLCWLFGEPTAICADIRTTVPTRERPDGTVLDVDADDSASVLLRMSSGVHATLTVSAVTLHAGARYRFEATGSAGTLAIDGSLYGGVLRGGQVGDPGLADLAGSRRAPRSGALPADGKRSLAAARHLALQLEDWLPAFDGRPAPHVPTLRDGLRVQRMISAARRSSAGEGWVTL